jgi:hypothetical protein
VVVEEGTEEEDLEVVAEAGCSCDRRVSARSSNFVSLFV